jgi:hypothetical protein
MGATAFRAVPPEDVAALPPESRAPNNHIALQLWRQGRLLGIVAKENLECPLNGKAITGCSPMRR